MPRIGSVIAMIFANAHTTGHAAPSACEPAAVKASIRHAPA